MANKLSLSLNSEKTKQLNVSQPADAVESFTCIGSVLDASVEKNVRSKIDKASGIFHKMGFIWTCRSFGFEHLFCIISSKALYCRQRRYIYKTRFIPLKCLRLILKITYFSPVSSTYAASSRHFSIEPPKIYKTHIVYIR